ncbi:hypothetical protein [Actinoplanes sp. TBRC 11911]|uniref:hypothetical protein n=1 Tax=Actinoplanes sp. TBRC 11911 TaxID=2729386 RepID=UPI0020071193|nr:hypothetical protein [Actinoplanes sp. TBRC 11911]
MISGLLPEAAACTARSAVAQARPLSYSLMSSCVATPYASASRCAAAACSLGPAAERLATAWASSLGSRRASRV